MCKKLDIFLHKSIETQLKKKKKARGFEVKSDRTSETALRSNTWAKLATFADLYRLLAIFCRESERETERRDLGGVALLIAWANHFCNSRVSLDSND